MLCKDLKDNTIKSFGLDRLSNLEITNRKFKFPANFDVSKYYENCFGIVGPHDREPEKIILSFSPIQGKYIQSLPLHASQKVLVNNEEELRIELKLFLKHDFYMEILSYGNNVKVIAPEKLRKRVKSSAQAVLKHYQE